MLGTTTIKRKKGLLAWAKAHPKNADVQKWAKRVRISPARGRAYRELTKLFQLLETKVTPSGIWNGPTIDAIAPWLPRPPFGKAVVAAARSQIGVVEVPVNAGPALAKYYRVGWGGAPNPYGWCTWFAAWCWQMGIEARGSKVKLGQQLSGVYMPNTGEVLKAARAGNKHLREVHTPAAGDWVCMFGGKHSGIYERRSAIPGYELHIEGNTSSDAAGSQWNGGGVYRKTRKRSRDVDGYVRYAP